MRISVAKSQTLVESVEVGRLDLLDPVAAQLTAQVVHGDEQDIGPIRAVDGGQRSEQQGSQEGKEVLHTTLFLQRQRDGLL